MCALVSLSSYVAVIHKLTHFFLARKLPDPLGIIQNLIYAFAFTENKGRPISKNLPCHQFILTCVTDRGCQKKKKIPGANIYNPPQRWVRQTDIHSNVGLQ